MVSGQHFRLLAETLGIETIGEDNRISVMVPAGETIAVLTGPHSDDKRMVEVQWGEKKLMMFVEDIENRGAQINPA